MRNQEAAIYMMLQKHGYHSNIGFLTWSPIRKIVPVMRHGLNWRRSAKITGRRCLKDKDLTSFIHIIEFLSWDSLDSMAKFKLGHLFKGPSYYIHTMAINEGTKWKKIAYIQLHNQCVFPHGDSRYCSTPHITHKVALQLQSSILGWQESLV